MPGSSSRLARLSRRRHRRRADQRRAGSLCRHQFGDHDHRHAQRGPGHRALFAAIALRRDQRGFHRFLSDAASDSFRSRSLSFSPPRSSGDIWLYRTRSGLKLRAVGFREEAAKRNGVRIDFVHLRAYLLSAVIAVLSGLFCRLGSGRRRPGHRLELHIDQHRRGGSWRRGADRRARLLRRRHAGRVVLHAHGQRHHAAQAQYRRRHHRQRRFDAVCGGEYIPACSRSGASG